jgi:hypothetical protein
MSSLSQAAVVSVRRTETGTPPKLMMATLWAAAVGALMVPAIKDGVFDALSTDDAMRLVQVRDLLAGQGWFDLVQHRLDPPGVAMHWSRVIDLPLAAMILMLRPMAGQHEAEVITLFAWPALLFVTTLRLVASITQRMTAAGETPSAQLAAMLLTVLSVPALPHFRAGAIDHHNAQIVLLLAFIALAQQIDGSPAKAGAAGVVAAFSLAIGLEMLPAIAAICVVMFAIQIWRGGGATRRIGLFGASMAGSSLLLAALLLTRQSLTLNVCDAFGGPVLLLMAGGGATLLIVACIDRWRPTFLARLAGGAAAGLGSLALFFHLFPGCLASPYANVAPLVTSFWLKHVFEAMSFFTMLELVPQKIPGIYGFPLIAVVAAALVTVRGARPARSGWIIAVVALVALISTSIWEMRGAAAATVVAAPIFAASLARFWPAREQERKLVATALALSPATLLVTGVAARPMIDMLLPPHWTIVDRQAASSCQTVSSVAPLALLPRGRVMAPIDLGPAILAATPHTVFAAPYHRNNDGNLAMLNLMLAVPPAAGQASAERDFDYIALCRNPIEQADFEEVAPDGLAARLGRGETFEFLQPLDLDPSGKLAVWRARR